MHILQIATSKAVRVLIVEDHDDSRSLLCRLLTGRGYQVAQAATAATGIDFAKVHPIDVVISDIGLPDATGTQFMQQFRQYQSSPGIAVSGYGSQSDIQASLDAGFHSHLTKPIDIFALCQIIEELGSFRSSGSAPALRAA